MSANTGSDTTSSSPNSKSTDDEPYSTIFEYSRSLLIGVVISIIVVFVLLIVAICKYRNRDEGTYTIDETKNCGPFAEIEAPLNGSKKKDSKKLAKNNRRKEINNKEWYV